MIINANSIVEFVIQIKNEIIKHVNVNIKITVSAEKDYNWNPRTCICENSKFIKSIAATSMTEYDEIVIVMDNVTTKKTIATNVTSTASINCHSIKVIDCHILHTVLLAIILLLIIIIFCYHYAKQKDTI